MSAPGLYGIENSNREGDDLWGKNQFNSTFPISLCCYMRDHGIPPVYISVDEDGEIGARDDDGVSMEDVFGTPRIGADIRFEFETVFEPLGDLLHDALSGVDVVTRTADGEFCRPLEVKLTVVPDNTTAKQAEEKWCSELVIRPITSAYAAIQLFANLSDTCRTEIRDIIGPVAFAIQDPDNIAEILLNADRIVQAMNEMIAACTDFQQPYLVQPIWKTVGKTAELANPCFDVFAWSNLAILKIPVDSWKGKKNKVTRSLREAVRHLWCFRQLLTVGKINYNEIYRGIALGNQTDKSFALNGTRTIKYMDHPRLRKPHFSSDILPALILNGGENRLSPERRFDATVFYTCKALLQRNPDG